MLQPIKQLPNLETIKHPTAPGVCMIYYVPVESMIADPSSFDALMQIQGIPLLTRWNKVKGPPAMREYTEVSKVSDAGPYVETTVNFFVPFVDKHNHEWTSDMLRRRFIVVVEVGKARYFLGSKENPVKLQLAFSAGSRKGSTGQGNTLSFVWQSERRPFQLAAFVVLDVLP